jgi:hypothetical protein
MDMIGTQSAGGCKGNFPKRSKKFARPCRTGIIGKVDDKYQGVAGFGGTMPATIGLDRRTPLWLGCRETLT